MKLRTPVYVSTTEIYFESNIPVTIHQEWMLLSDTINNDLGPRQGALLSIQVGY